jgi:hypothetical protein
VDRTGLTIVPAAVVFTANGQLVYRGRIDDRVVSLGVWRPMARTRDLALALDRSLAGRATTLVTTPAVGCYIKPAE